MCDTFAVEKSSHSCTFPQWYLIHSMDQRNALCNSVHNRKWRGRHRDWLRLCGWAGPRSPIGRTPQPLICFFRGPLLIDANILIIYLAPDQLLKRQVGFTCLATVRNIFQKTRIKTKTHPSCTVPEWRHTWWLNDGVAPKMHCKLSYNTYI